MADQLSETEKALARAALWSVATSSNHLDVAQLPAAVRPRRVEEAIEIINDLDDPGAPARRGATIGMAASGAFGAGRNIRPRLTPLVDPVTFDPTLALRLLTQLLLPILGMSAALLELVRKFIKDFEKHGLCSIPAGSAGAPAKYNGVSKQTEICAYYLTTRSLEDLQVLLDPRNWAECGDVFRETRRVVGPVRRPYHSLEPDPDLPGKEWRGYLYESTDMGTAANDVVLSVYHRAIQRQDPTTGVAAMAAVEIDFHLVDSVSTSLGPFDLTGLVEEDSGNLRAEALPEQSPFAPYFKTKIRCIKTVRTGRISSWSGGAGWDFGELLNYLSPAVLTLWATHLQSVVPCCAKPH